MKALYLPAALRRRALFMGAFSLLFVGYSVAQTAKPKKNSKPTAKAASDDTAKSPTDTAPDPGYYNPSFNFISMVGGVEQVDLSSQPSQTERHLRAYTRKSTPVWKGPHDQFLAWASVRLLGSPNQGDTQGVFSVFTDPTGQITTTKLSSVGAGTDFMIGGSYRFHVPDPDPYVPALELILGFGATTPFPSNKVTQAFTAPAFGTTECNILFQKLRQDFTALCRAMVFSKSSNGMATGSTTTCLLNSNDPTTSNGTTTYAPISTIAFSSSDRTSFLFERSGGPKSHTSKVGGC